MELDLRSFERFVLAIVVTLISVTLYVMATHAATRRVPRVFDSAYMAQVVRVVDGDTIVANVEVWPRVLIKTSVRLAGVDTPESSRRFAKCDEERVLGVKAKQYVRDLIKPGDPIIVVNPKLGKYAGRVVADIKYQQFFANYADLAELLKTAGFARPYDGGKKSDWCSKGGPR